MNQQNIPVSKTSYWQNKDYVYVPSHATDILKRFKSQFNWQPPSEIRKVS